MRAVTEALAEPLGPEDQTVQSMPDVSPTKWHRAHVSWFFEEFVLSPFASGYEPFDPMFRYLFNSYYEAVGRRHPRPERGLVSRPTTAEVTAYRQWVDASMLAFVDSSAFASASASGSGSDEVGARVELGLHHEQQHQELLLMDAKHVLSQSPLDPVYRPAYRRTRRPAGDGQRSSPAPFAWTEHVGGVVEIGHGGDGFAYDNEAPRHEVLLRPFSLADRPVTAGEWLAFIDDGGYRRPELWLSDGWATVQAQGWTAPLYWRDEGAGDGWSVFTLAGRRMVDPGEPVCHVSYYEADAYARWAGARLPSEAEWETAALGLAVDESHCLDLDVLHPAPVAAPASTAAAGPALLYGGVWEWTASPYTPYPGFWPAAGAVGEYNGKFMVNQHVLRGGSCATPRGHIRPTYRNFFPPSARWAFSGLRLAKDAS